MDVKQGLKRTAIVIAAFWVIGWSFVAWQADMQANIAHAEYKQLEQDHPGGLSNPTYVSMSTYWMEKSNEASDKMGYAVVIGLFGPIGLLMLSPFLWFIYRGFRPKQPPGVN